MKSNLGSRSCLKCGDELSGQGCASSQVLVGELDLVDTISRQPVRHHFKFHRKCFESFKSHSERRDFMKRATEVGLVR
jgi:hypothetical protein